MYLSPTRKAALTAMIREAATGKCVLLAPAMAELEPQLLGKLSQAEAILFDGTFWADEDFEKSGIGGFCDDTLFQSHLPILTGSLGFLSHTKMPSPKVTA
jgi:hypothetical protein